MSDYRSDLSLFFERRAAGAIRLATPAAEALELMPALA
jgi:hypothetical protein